MSGVQSGKTKCTPFSIMDAKWSNLYALFFFISLGETTSTGVKINEVIGKKNLKDLKEVSKIRYVVCFE